MFGVSLQFALCYDSIVDACKAADWDKAWEEFGWLEAIAESELEAAILCQLEDYLNDYDYAQN